jgi:hypothetical protein
MKAIVHALARRSLLLWTTVFAIFAIAAWLRAQSIDRTTPVIGISVYLMMLIIFFVVVAVPAAW